VNRVDVGTVQKIRRWKNPDVVLEIYDDLFETTRVGRSKAWATTAEKRNALARKGCQERWCMHDIRISYYAAWEEWAPGNGKPWICPFCGCQTLADARADFFSTEPTLVCVKCGAREAPLLGRALTLLRSMGGAYVVAEVPQKLAEKQLDRWRRCPLCGCEWLWTDNQQRGHWAVFDRAGQMLCERCAAGSPSALSRTKSHD